MPVYDKLREILNRLLRNRQLVRSVAAVSGGNLVSTLLGVAGGLIVARFLGPDITGLFRSFTIPMMYLTFLHLGTFDGLWRQIPYNIGQGTPEKNGPLVSSAGAWSILISAVTSSGFVIYGLYSLLGRDPIGFVGWFTQAVMCWLTFYGGYLGATYRTLNHFVALARIQLIQAFVNFGMVFTLPFLGFYGLCARSVSAAALNVTLTHRRRPMKLRYRLQSRPLRELIRIGFPFTVWGSLNTSIWSAAENTLMLGLGGVTNLGLFMAAAILRDGMTIFPQAVNQVMMPRIVEGYGKDKSVRAATARSLVPTVWLTGGMIILVIATSSLLDWIVPALIPKYAAGISLMKVCLWFAVVQTLTLPFNTLFAAGRPWIVGRGVILGMVSFVAVAWLISPQLGAVLGVAVGSLVGRTVRTIEAYLELFVLARREAIDIPMGERS